ncbi:hypothetical protein B0H10DRAFT_2015070 [Mycena sp. CBHHK59/15]|nr:hypothetical protein B0H10DRAFT_2015070 [Mycena sp. CBHHK59/15]
MTVFSFVDKHPAMTQQDIANHFKTLHTGSLDFTQETLSRKLKQRPELEKRANSHPNALSMKRDRVVTRPDVERALVLWVDHMGAKGETVTGDMLIEKRARFETEFHVPDEQRLRPSEKSVLGDRARQSDIELLLSDACESW